MTAGPFSRRALAAASATRAAWPLWTPSNLPTATAPPRQAPGNASFQLTTWLAIAVFVPPSAVYPPPFYDGAAASSLTPHPRPPLPWEVEGAGGVGRPSRSMQAQRWARDSRRLHAPAAALAWGPPEAKVECLQTGPTCPVSGNGPFR